MENLYAMIPDASSTVVLIVFMLLWHKRTMARDEQFADTIRQTNDALMTCMSSMVKSAAE